MLAFAACLVVIAALAYFLRPWRMPPARPITAEDRMDWRENHRG